MQNRPGVLLFLILLSLGMFLLFAGTIGAFELSGIIITPEQVVLRLPQSGAENYSVSITQHPMKVIVDANVSLSDVIQDDKIQDVALREVRHTQLGDDRYRLVLEFNYQVLEPVIRQEQGLYEVIIGKTYVHTSERMVIPGITYGHQRRADSFGPNVVNFLVVDLPRRDLVVRLALAQDRVFGSEHVSTMAERLGAIAAVNGAFFAGDGRPLGVFMIDGELISEPYANRTALGIGPDTLLMDGVGLQGEVRVNGELLAQITGLNRGRLQDDLIIYTPHFGNSTKTNAYGYEVTVVNGVITQLNTGNSVIPPNGVVLSGHGINKSLLENLTSGDQVDLLLELEPNWLAVGVEQIIGGGPRLVKDGDLLITGTEERFRDDVLKGRAPRTALGITEDNQLIMLTVNGRQPNISVGMTLTELGNLLIELGAVQAMNLDGGGSTTMVIRNLVLNLPSDGKERPVSNAIVILPGKAAGPVR